MNQREAKIRGLKIAIHILKEAFESGDIINMVDEDTTDEDAERIANEVNEIRYGLIKRVDSHNAAEIRARRKGKLKRKGRANG